MDDARERIPVGDRVVITTRGKKNIYVAEFHDSGVHRRISLKTRNKKVALERAAMLAGKLVHGHHQAIPTAVGLTQTSQDYIAYLTTERRARKTIVKYKGVLDGFIDFVGTHRVILLNQVLPGHFDRYREEMKKTLHEKTTYTKSVVIKQFFKWAKSRRLIAENPLADIKLKKPPLVPKPAPSFAQVDAVLAEAEEPLFSKLAILAFTGMRSGELQRLRLTDIDFDGNWIHIVSRDGAETKTRRSRKVPIHRRLMPILKALSKRPRPFLFTSEPSREYSDGNQPMNTKRLNQQFQRLMKKLGMPVGINAGFVTHSLRHFFETFCINNGIPQRVVDAWLGHHGDKSMGAIYYSLSDVDSQAFMTKVPFGSSADSDAA